MEQLKIAVVVLLQVEELVAVEEVQDNIEIVVIKETVEVEVLEVVMEDLLASSSLSGGGGSDTSRNRYWRWDNKFCSKDGSQIVLVVEVALVVAEVVVLI